MCVYNVVCMGCSMWCVVCVCTVCVCVYVQCAWVDSQSPLLPDMSEQVSNFTAAETL